jgi:hypothetical protein
MARRNKKHQHPEAQAAAVPAPSNPRLRLALFGAVAATIIAAGALRIWAARDQFWMDEIWSLVVFLPRIKSPLDVLTLHHDNNHYLVTFWMYLLGPLQMRWLVYRAPSIVAGIGTVALAALLGRRWGDFATFAAALLTGASYMLVVYASEARGYALEGFFALAAFLALDRYLARPRVWANLVFVALCVLGILSHLTFVEFYLAALVWSGIRCRRTLRTSPSAVRHMAALHAVPLCFLAALYAIDLRYLVVGGGDVIPLNKVLPSTLALAVGSFAEQPDLAALTGLPGLAAAVVALVLLRRERSDLWVFFAVAIFAAPALVFLITRPTPLYERYFYLNILFFLVLCSYLLDRVWRLGMAGRGAAVLALLLFVLGNAKMTYDFLRLGRGHFRDVLDYMVENTAQRDITIGNVGERSRNVIYAEFFSRYLPPDRRLAFIDLAGDSPAEPEWFIFNGDKNAAPPVQLVLPLKSHPLYIRERVYPSAGLSGMTFAIYHRAANRRAATPQ